MKRDLGFIFIICLVLSIMISTCKDEDEDDVTVVKLEGSYDFYAANIEYFGSSLISTNTPEMIDPSVIYVITDEADLAEFNALVPNLDDNSFPLELSSLDTYDYFIFKALDACTSTYELVATEQRSGSIMFTLHLRNLDEADPACTEDHTLKLWIYRGFQVSSLKTIACPQPFFSYPDS